MSPVASVIIPTYRRPQFVERAINSVEAAVIAYDAKSQFEVIIVDDGWDEQTQNIVEGVPESGQLQIRYIRRQKCCQGPSSARDYGIRQSRSEIIYLLDDDDEFLPNRFGESLCLLKNGEADAVFEPSLRVNVADEQKEEYITGPNGTPIDTFRFVLTGGPRSHITPGATAFAKALYFKVGGYDKSLRFGEDGELLLRFCLHGRVKLIDSEPVVKIDIHGHNTSRYDRIYAWQNIKYLSALLRKMRQGDWPEETALVEYSLAGKIKYALSAARLQSSSYLERIMLGGKALWYFDWRCFNYNTLKSILVWLFKE